MKCQNCGAELKNDARFCGQCGHIVSFETKKIQFCSTCGTKISGNEKRCMVCGSNLFSNEFMSDSDQVDNFSKGISSQYNRRSELKPRKPKRHILRGCLIFVLMFYLLVFIMAFLGLRYSRKKSDVSEIAQSVDERETRLTEERVLKTDEETTERETEQESRTQLVGTQLDSVLEDIESATEKSTEIVTERATDSLVEKVTEAEAGTERNTEIETEVVTEMQTEKVSEAMSEVPNRKEKEKYSSTSNLNVRNSPSTDSDVIGSINYGDNVDVYEINNGWATIDYNGKEAYVSADYLVSESEQQETDETEQKTEHETTSVHSSNSSKSGSVSYSTNDKETVKNGNTGVYAYKSKGASYSNYSIIDFDQGYVYFFSEGNGSETCERLRIESGDLNSVLIITYHDGGDVWQNGLHFKWRNQPERLILEDNYHFETEFSATDLEKALNIKNQKNIIDY